jgi:hypothetical protein
MSMSLSTVLAKLTKPRISSTVSALGELTGGALFHALFLNLRDCGRSRHMCRVHGRGEISSSCIALSVLDFGVGLSGLGNIAFDVRLALCRGRQAPAGASRRG